MLNKYKRWLFPAIAAVLCLIWCGAVLVLVKPGCFTSQAWMCFGLNILAFVLYAAVWALVLQYTAQAGISNVVPVYVAHVYLVLAIILNTVGVILNREELKSLFTALNIILTGIFVVYELGALAFSARTVETLKNARARADQQKPALDLISSLLTEDITPETRQKLLKLKETANYSVDHLSDPEQILTESIENLRCAILDKMPQEEIDARIADVERTWKSKTAR